MIKMAQLEDIRKMYFMEDLSIREISRRTGLRCGELLGLKWEDVDLSKGRITIRRSLIKLKEGLDFSEPKTEKSRRTIPLPVEVVKELKTWKTKQAEEKLFLGPAYQDNGLVFCEIDGTPLAPRNFTRIFDKLLIEAELPKISS